RASLLDLTVRSNPAARRRLRNAVIDGEWLGTGPITYGRRRPATGVLAIGDARGFIDPFTGSRILLALMRGELAAQIGHQALDERINSVETINARYHALHRRQFGLRFHACAILRGIAFQPFARNAIVSLLSRHRTIMRLVALSTRQ